jgi:hypothetical protein
VAQLHACSLRPAPWAEALAGGVGSSGDGSGDESAALHDVAAAVASLRRRLLQFNAA